MGIALTLALVTVVLSGMFSGLETGIYRLSRLRLRLGAERGELRYVLLSQALCDGSSLLLTLLVANNLANYLATSSITYLFLTVASDRTAELLATSLTAPLLFVFGESLPKNTFLYRPDVLTPYLGPFVYAIHKVLTWSGVVPLLGMISRSLARLGGAPIPSKKMMVSSQIHQVKAILRDMQEEGPLSHMQTEMLDRVVNIPNLRLGTVMIPMPRVQAIPLETDRAALLEGLKRQAFTRLLVCGDGPANVIGFVNVYEALASAEEFRTVEGFLQPIRSLDTDTLVTEAIETLRREQVKMILVTRRRSGRDVPVGIVTMKDLVEELMGELAEW
ncbi:MAG TPA: CNNM domain-containing protein [Sedimentisphaerales bacterium]|jgi:CBS domain containing-hemolysin-like protein|nr:CNNM domain-containing protein [Sedimentisphaerales bacterium]HNU28488.1 CNNM domain-containing protein [Sedimentisphaerales bacterium]